MKGIDKGKVTFDQGIGTFVKHCDNVVVVYDKSVVVCHIM